jgi:hypothetical protein
MIEHLRLLLSVALSSREISERWVENSCREIRLHPCREFLLGVPLYMEKF